MMNYAYRPHMIVAVLAFAFWSTGCTTRVHGHAYADVPEVCCAEPEVVYVEPELVEIQPELWVVCDHHSAVYFHFGSYWHYETGVWWQSSTWGGPRVRVQVHTVPGVIFHQDHRGHVRFRGHAYAKRRRGPAHRASHHGSATGRSRSHWGHQASYGDRKDRQPEARNPSRPKPRAQRPSTPRSRPATWNQSRPKPRAQRPSTPRPRPVARNQRPATKLPRPAAKPPRRTAKPPRRTAKPPRRTAKNRRPAIPRPRATSQPQRNAAPSRAVVKRPRKPARQDDKRKKRRAGRR